MEEGKKEIKESNSQEESRIRRAQYSRKVNCLLYSLRMNKRKDHLLLRIFNADLPITESSVEVTRISQKARSASHSIFTVLLHLFMDIFHRFERLG